MSSNTNDTNEPWSMFADEAFPHRDLDRLRRLDSQLEDLEEMADALGCSKSTARKWLKKAYEEAPPTDEQMQCNYYEVCGNEVPAPGNALCPTCLDLVRENERIRRKFPEKGLEPVNFESTEAYVQALYDEFADRDRITTDPEQYLTDDKEEGDDE